MVQNYPFGAVAVVATITVPGKGREFLALETSRSTDLV